MKKKIIQFKVCNEAIFILILEPGRFFFQFFIIREKVKGKYLL